MRLLAIGLVGLLGVLACAPRAGALDDAAVRSALLAEINRDRERAGVPPLRLAAPLSKVAQARAEELARQGDLRSARGAEERTEQAMVRAGYRAERWIESEVASSASIEEVVRYWRRQSGDTHRQVMGRDFKDLGIGVTLFAGGALYTLLFAVPERDYYAERTKGLADRAAVRRAVLDAVNTERRKARARPLALDSRLDEAAERHAQDMLARGYFAHESPEGKTVRQRAKAAGYDWHAVGENIALGQLSVEQVMDAWMKSPEHRRNILDRDFVHMGLGLAIGEGPQGFRVVWVQTFGHP
jgi:uncharacterized protein YkwD